jgi:UDP-N-acetylmuramoyl-tripeptide--D-alanyl-D-alanine ligase
MNKLKLSTVAQWCGGRLQGNDTEIDNVSIDSRAVNTTSLFVAIKGERFDAHDFAKQVEESGAAAMVCHREVDVSIPVIYVEDTKKAFIDIARNYRQSIKNLTVIGLTGSVGKTTTKEMTYLVASKKFNAIKTQGNLNNDIGLPRTLFTLDDSYNGAVIEMGMSAFGEISLLSKTCLPDIGIITNIGVSHIEHLGSRDGILKAKLEILDGMKKGSTLILNYDNDKLQTVKTADYNIVSFGIDNKEANVIAQNITEKDGKTSFDVLSDGKTQSVTIPTIGIHNVYDALAAYCVGLEIGLETSVIAEALGEYVPSGMRQRINKVNGVTVIEDCYNASPDSQRAAINALMSIEGDRKIAVLGDMLELGDYSATAHTEIGEYAAAKKVDLLYTYGEESKNIAAAAESNGVKVFAFTDKEALFEALRREIKPSDVVLFKASRGMKLEEVINKLYEEWKDK